MPSQPVCPCCSSPQTTQPVAASFTGSWLIVVLLLGLLLFSLPANCTVTAVIVGLQGRPSGQRPPAALGRHRNHGRHRPAGRASPARGRRELEPPDHTPAAVLVLRSLSHGLRCRVNPDGGTEQLGQLLTARAQNTERERTMQPRDSLRDPTKAYASRIIGSTAICNNAILQQCHNSAWEAVAPSGTSVAAN